MISRRRFLLAGGAGLASVAYGPRVAFGQQRAARQTITLTATAAHMGQYLYLPFEVPGGVSRIDVSVTKQGDAKTGAGLFDHRGAGYQSAGFHGHATVSGIDVGDWLDWRQTPLRTPAAHR